MSLRISAWLCVCLLAAGCGFQTVYGKKDREPAPQALAGVRVIEASRQYTDQLMQNALEDRLNPQGVPADPRYSLTYSLAMSETPIGIARDGTVSRYNVNMDMQYRLERYAPKILIASGSLRHVSSYNNVVGAYYSTFVAREDGIKRGTDELAVMLVSRLSPLLVQENPLPVRQPEVPIISDSPLSQPVFDRPEFATQPISPR